MRPWQNIQLTALKIADLAAVNFENENDDAQKRNNNSTNLNNQTKVIMLPTVMTALTLHPFSNK